MARFKTQDEVINQLEAKFPNQFDYSKFVYSQGSEPVTLICKTHGEIHVKTSNILYSKNSKGCTECWKDLKKEIHLKDLNDFTEQANKIHNYQFDYSNSVYLGSRISITALCTLCNKEVSFLPTNHLKGHKHNNCVKVGIKKPSQGYLEKLQRENKKMSKEWRYTPDWSEEEMMNGSYCGFVYLFQFEDGSTYVGSKQIYKRVKDYKKIKPDSVENGWREYSSSSRLVNQKISDGMEYTKTILWCFKDMKETLFVELMLILNEGLKPHNMNLAIMYKGRVPTGDNGRRIQGIIKELISYLN